MLQEFIINNPQIAVLIGLILHWARLSSKVHKKRRTCPFNFSCWFFYITERIAKAILSVGGAFILFLAIPLVYPMVFSVMEKFNVMDTKENIAIVVALLSILAGYLNSMVFDVLGIFSRKYIFKIKDSEL